MLSKIRELFTIPSHNRALTAAQLRAFSKQIPLLYLVLLTNTGFVSASHFGLAPNLLTLYLPGVFSLLCVGRLVMWWRVRNSVVAPAEAAARLSSTRLLSGFFGACFTAWGLALFPFGGSLQQMHVVYYMSITMIACVFCLMHLRAAALTLSLIVTIPFAAYFGTRGEPVLLAIAANAVLVAAAMIYVLNTHYRDFALMITQQGELEVQHAEQRRLSDENYRLAHVDSLTSMANRRSFLSSIARDVAQAAVSGNEIAVGLIDLDGFKAVNDIYGHASGDRLLVEASRRLMAIESTKVSFARLGGDEFGLIYRGGDTAELVDVADLVCRVLSEPFVIDGMRLGLSGSVGLARYPAAGTSVERLVENADYALYQAKSRHPGLHVIFNENHAAAIRRLHLVTHNLRSADVEQELALAFQPVVALGGRATVGFEALARWHNPALGGVSPGEFIKAAERSDIINRLSLILFRKALDEAASWRDREQLYFNLSARNVVSPEFSLQIAADIMKSKVDPQRIVFEVTETAIMGDFEQAHRCLARLRGIGCGIALDDFGSGYSSLSYVHRLPLDKIKIDGRFTAELESSPMVRSIVRSIVDLTENLGLECVAEGIETAEQAELLVQMGVKLGQGYYLGRPAVPGSAPAANASA